MNAFRIRLFAAAALVGACGLAHAADTGSISVSAEVRGICKFTNINPLSIVTPTLTYLDPSSTADGTGTAVISYKCTKGYTPGTFSVGGSTTGTYTANTATTALAGAAAGNTTTIPFTITWGARPQGQGFSTAVDITLTGTILNANFVDAPADTYSRSVSLAINN